MSETTAYHRKLAEAIAVALGEQVGFSIRAVMTKEPVWPIIAAVLASEGVVDPVMHRYWTKKETELYRENCELKAKVERLEADKKECGNE